MIGSDEEKAKLFKDILEILNCKECPRADMGCEGTKKCIDKLAEQGNTLAKLRQITNYEKEGVKLNERDLFTLRFEYPDCVKDYEHNLKEAEENIKKTKEEIAKELGIKPEEVKTVEEYNAEQNKESDK